METALRSLLTGYAPLMALVDETSVAWGLLPQGHERPSVALYVVSGARNYTMAGPDNLRPETVQVDCWAFDYPKARAVAQAVEDRLSGRRDSTFSGIFLRAFRNSVEKQGSETFHRISLDFEVWSTP